MAFVKLIVWLTTPNTRISQEALVIRYRDTIIKHQNYCWNNHPSGIRPGKGMGAKPDALTLPQRQVIYRQPSKRNGKRDFIAFNHLLLAQNLQFIKKGETLWDKNGYILASLSSGQNGKPLFYDPNWLKQALQKEGFIGVLGKGEQLIFSTSLIEKDFDRILPLLSLLEDPANNVVDRFLFSVDKWLERKISLQSNSFKRGQIELERRNIKQKISRLETENKQPEKFTEAKKNSRSNSPSIRVYCQEQTSPRLHFLWDLDYIERDNKGFHLTEKGLLLKRTLIDSFYAEKTPGSIDATTFDNETNLLESIVDISVRGLPPLEFDQFKVLFASTARFYAQSGVILLSYFNTFKAIASKTIENSMGLSLNLFDNYMSKLSQLKEVTVSTSGRGTKYIKVYYNLKGQ